jgi:glycosyltransferase involved in cell wall biosynthesis
MKILFYAKAPDATEFYRVKIPVKFLREAGYEVRANYAERIPNHNAGVKDEDLKWADIIIFQRPVTQVVLAIIKHIKEKYPKIPIVADYDDDYYSVPRWNPGYPHLKTNEKYWKSLVKEFDGVMTSTEPLKEVFEKKVNKRCEVRCIPNGFDFDMFDPLEPFEPVQIMAPDPTDSQSLKALYTIDTLEFNQMMEDKIVCCWAGSKFHYVDLDWLPESIGKICELRDDICFLFVGYSQGNLIKKSQVNKFYLTKGQSPVSRFYQLLKSIKIDLMLAPLDPCQFNRSKSNLKIMESMALGAYPICSQWDAYEYDLDPDFYETEMDNVHGTLVPYSKNAWYEAITVMADKIKDQNYAKKVRLENDAFVRSTHSAELRTELYVNFFQKLIAKKAGK